MWIEGSILNICGSIMVNLAANLLKLAHNVEETDKTSPNKQHGQETPKYDTLRRCFTSLFGSNVYNSKVYWRLGATLFAAGSVINFLSLSMAAQSLLATLGGVQFVSNIFFARCILGEKVTKKGLIATSIIIIGLTVAVSFSDHNSTRYNSSGLIALYDRTYITFISCVAATLLLAECVYIMYTTREKSGNPLPYSFIVRPVAYSMVSATIGTQSVLQSKCLAELLRTDIAIDRSSGNDLFANGLLYLVLTVIILGMSFWLYRLNNALKLFDGLVIIPIIQVFWVTSAILQGGMYFQEFKEMKAHQSFLFSIGVITVFFGVYLIATSQGSADVTGNNSDRTVLTLDDQTTDIELGDTDRELLRKRSDSSSSGISMACVNSPYHHDTNVKKFNSSSSKNHSINISNKSENHAGSNEFDNGDRLDDDYVGENDAENDISFEGIELVPPSEICTLLPVQRNGTVHTFSPSHSHKHNSNSSVSSTTSTSSTSYCPTSFEKSPVQNGTLHMTSSQIGNNGNTHTDTQHAGTESKEYKGLKDYKRGNYEDNRGDHIQGLSKSKSENLNFSPLSRPLATLHVKERSLSSCGLLEMAQEEEDGMEDL